MESALLASLSKNAFFPRTAINDSCSELGNAIIYSSGSSLHLHSIHGGRKNHPCFVWDGFRLRRLSRQKSRSRQKTGKRDVMETMFRIEGWQVPLDFAHFSFMGGRRNGVPNAPLVFAALPENSPSIILAAIAVGAAATLLARKTTSPISNDITTKACEECGGSGVCSGCNGEGFILKKLSEESADKARMASKNMATRYTAGLPKKWSYCTKCSSSRFCRTCDGTGSVSS